MSAEYIHGTAPSEQERLSTLNQLMNEGSLREARIRPGERIVDFGSGLGQLSLQMARAAGVKLLGIERSEEQLGRSERHELLDLRQGTAEAPPLRDDEWGRFDVAHARFILEHVQEPLAVVKQMVRAVRPGGRILLEDDDHDVLRLHPEVAGLAELWTAYIRTYERIGCDPYVGRRLPQLLQQAGARPVRSTFIFFGACAGEPTFAPLVANLAGVIESARGQLLGGAGSPGDGRSPQGAATNDAAEFDETLARLRAWAQRPDAALWYAIFWAEGVRA